jgi:Uma2 family endonuclease
MIDLKQLRPEEIRPLKRREYDRLIELGCFEDERIELLSGVLVAKEPQGAYHSDLMSAIAEDLGARVVGRARIRVQCPFAASDDSEPEPDIALVPNRQYRRALPSKALLVVEVAGSSSKRDRTLKAAIYARGDVQEYWVVDLAAKATYVFRDRGEGAWASMISVPWTSPLSPLAFPDIVLRIAELG